MRVCMCVHMYVCVHACMHVYVRACVCVCICTCVHVYVCPSPRLSIISGMMWNDMNPSDWLNKFYNFYNGKFGKT